LGLVGKHETLGEVEGSRIARLGEWHLSLPLWVDKRDPYRYYWGSVFPSNIRTIQEAFRVALGPNHGLSGYGRLLYTPHDKSGIFIGIEVEDFSGTYRRYPYAHDQPVIEFAKEVFKHETEFQQSSG
jgi:hypothetical protein